MLLTATVLAPLVGALACLAVPGRAKTAALAIALAASLAALALAVAVAVAFDPGAAGFQLVADVDWVASLGVSYKVGVDGISLPLVLLTAVLTPLAIVGAWRNDNRPRGYVALLLLLESALLGVFVSLDLFVFYLFWEAVLIPTYFLVGIWGGPGRVRAAVKFFLYTLLGGLLMLVAILGLYALAGDAGQATFDYETLRDLTKQPDLQRWLFAGFFAAFAIKTPLFPLHTWLPDTYTEAPSTTTVLLAGVMSKMGVYGLVRFALPMFPDAARWAEPVLLTLAVASILYAALVAIVQTDFKRLIAYSSVSHLGFIALGLFALSLQGVQGAVFYMVAHGLVTGGMFFMIGMLEERVPSRRIADFGGLQKVVPRMAGVMLVLTLATAALPGLVGFVGEFLTLLGAFLNNRLAAVLATGGVILGAVYVLWAYQRMWQGELTHERNRAMPDLSAREWVVLVPLLVGIVVLGVLPGALLDRIEPAAKQVVEASTVEASGP